MAAAAFYSATFSAWAEPAPKWDGHVDLEGKAGTKRHLGEADLFLPVAQNDHTLLFADIRTRMDDDSSREGNFGLGVRHMLEGGWNLGGYGYFDRRRSEQHNTFNQATIGAEVLSQDWDLRANAYLPVGTRSREVDSLNTATIEGTSVVFRGGEERSLAGFDGEIGWRVPVFALDSGVALRVFGGGYRFTADGVPDVTGPRGRIEMVVDQVPGLWEGARLAVGAEAQHDDPRGSQGFLGARLRIPLQIHGTPPSALTAMERRMTDPVVRDIDVVTRAGAFGAAETVTKTASGQNLTFVSSATTAGADLDDAVATAGANSTVVLSGSFTTTATVTLQTGQTVMGAGTLTVRSPSGRTATLVTTVATVQTSAVNTTVEMGGNSTLTGLTVSNTFSGAEAHGILAAQPGAVIRGNVVTVRNTNGAGINSIAVAALGDGTIVEGNTLIARGLMALSGHGIYTSNGPNITISGNTIDSTHYTITGNNFSSYTAASTGNVRISGGCNAGGGAGSVYFTDGTSCP